MPFGIRNIYMYLDSADFLQLLISEYFDLIAGQFHFEDVTAKTKGDEEVTERKKVWDRQPEPPTISGLALYLGFESRGDMHGYEQTGEFAGLVKRARLRIETEYEKKLHQPSPSGAIFALKNLCWNERELSPVNNNLPQRLDVNIVNGGPPLAGNEKDVVI